MYEALRDSDCAIRRLDRSVRVAVNYFLAAGVFLTATALAAGLAAGFGAALAAGFAAGFGAALAAALGAAALREGLAATGFGGAGLAAGFAAGFAAGLEATCRTEKNVALGRQAENVGTVSLENMSRTITIGDNLRVLLLRQLRNQPRNPPPKQLRSQPPSPQPRQSPSRRRRPPRSS